MKINAVSTHSSSSPAVHGRAKSHASAAATAAAAAAASPGVIASIGGALASGVSAVAGTTVTLSQRALSSLEAAGKSVAGVVEDAVGTAVGPNVRDFASGVLDDATGIVSDVVKAAAFGVGTGLI